MGSTETEQFDEELRASRKNLALEIQAGGIGIWNYFPKSRKLYWNDQLYQLFGLEPRRGPEEEETFFQHVHPEDRMGVLRDMQSILKSCDEIDLEFRIVRADGHVRWLAAKGTIQRDEAGKPVRLQGVNFDITEQKQTEKALEEKRRALSEKLLELEQINRELSEYAYAVSHDLKAPLRAVRNYADFLIEDLEGELSGDQKTYLEGMKKALSQGDELIQALLNFSSIGQSPEASEEVDLKELICEVYELATLPEEASVEVRSGCPPLFADRTLLKQILLNLISNGIKFNNSNVRKVEIWCRPALDGRVELLVKDNGIGIGERYQEQIFRMFQRLHSTKDYEGTGIGLAIVRKAAGRMGGSVRLESTPGAGSTFIVNLPGKPES
jgi:PAS domain S-box-containing protein